MKISLKAGTVFLLLVLLYACGNGRETKDKYAEGRTQGGSEAKEANRLYTTPANRLYFKNVRSLYYDKESNTAARLDYYRYKERIRNENLPVLNLAIVDAWARDEAYLIIEPNSFFESKDSFAIQWDDAQNKMKGYFEYVRKTPKDDYDFVRNVYGYMLQDNITLSYKNKPLFDKDRKEVFRKTFKDFEKLISEK